MKIRRALISVADKTRIVEFARALTKLDIQIISTGGTATLFRQNEIPVFTVSEITGFPEILDGRVKTLHPKIHGAILADREKVAHSRELHQNTITPIDLVVVNLYPFSETVSKDAITHAEAVEQIDIGGPTLLRAAAKNFGYVTAVVDHADYDVVLEQLHKNAGWVGLALRLGLAQKVFAHTAAYDSAVATYLSSLKCPAENTIETDRESPRFPRHRLLALEKIRDLRYGENPHQKGALYRELESVNRGITQHQVLQGKELSFNNLLDSDAAWQLVWEFEAPAAAIIKHTNPSGVAAGENLTEAYIKAYRCDPASAFGSVLGFNRSVDQTLADEVVKTFVEVIIAPEYTEEALRLFKTRKNLRLLKTDPYSKEKSDLDFRRVTGGFLIQDRDTLFISNNDLKVVTQRKPSEQELSAMLFAWKVVKHVKSNAIVYAFEDRTVGIGIGQTSRVDSVKLGAMKAQASLKGCALASDAFFPFRDGVDEAAKVGVRAIIQPGGSVRDEEVVRAANEHDMAMVLTGIRHFKH